MRNIFNRSKLLLVIMLPLLSLTITGCFKNYEDDFNFKGLLVEFDAASWQSKAPGKTYPVLGPFDKGSGVARFKVNLVGAQQPVDQIVKYRVVAGESTAQEGLHFALEDNGEMIIPANSNTGEVAINVLDFPPASGTVTLVLELIGNDLLKPSENYKQLGISISLTGRPSEIYPLHTQIGEGSFYNTIAIDISQPGLSQNFLDRWADMKANLLAFSTGGRTPYGMQIRLGADNKARVTLVYATTAALSFSYAYASWIYDLELDAQGVGKFVFSSSNDANATNLRAAGVMAPLLENWLEQHDFKVQWVDDAISTPRAGAQIGGVFQVSDPSSYVFGELTYIDYASNTPRPMPTSPAVYGLFEKTGGYYTSVLIDPESADQSQSFKDRWAAGKADIAANSAGRILNQFMIAFDPQFNDVIVVMAYANSTSTSKLIAQTRYWMRMTHDAELSFDYIHRNANATATSPADLFSNFIDIKQFVVTRTGDKLTFTDKNDPSSYFTGTLGDLAISANSFSWWF
jgi:hypothetical protein